MSLKRISIAFLSVPTFFLIWEILSQLRIIDPFIFPPFSSVCLAMLDLALNGELVRHVSISLTRAFLGLALALILAVPTGVLIGWYSWLRLSLEGIIEFLRPIPAIALIFLFIFLFGIGETSKILLITYACYFPIFLNTLHGVRHVQRTFIMAAKTMGASQFEILWRVIFNATLPSILAGLRISTAIALILLVSSEMVGASSGLGWLILASSLTYDIPKMYAGILTISLIGIFCNVVLMHVTKYILKWERGIY